MINHSVQSMSLAEYDEGEVALPNEAGLVTFPSNLRQFILLTRRAYNEAALINLEHTEGINIRYHGEDEAAPYFGLNLKFKPVSDELEDFVEESGDDFFSSILRAAATSTKRGLSGERAAFVREFRRSTLDGVDVMETKILISTSVFFNDYRVTVGFPQTELELEDVTAAIFNQLRSQWGQDVKLEVEAFFEPYTEEQE